MSRVAIVATMLILLPRGAAAQEQIVIDGLVYRDPTQPPGMTREQTLTSSVPGRVAYTVSFIRVGGANTVAVVNSQVVSVGDSVDRAIVRAIEPDRVVLEVDGQMLEISTFRAAFRTPAVP